VLPVLRGEHGVVGLVVESREAREERETTGYEPFALHAPIQWPFALHAPIKWVTRPHTVGYNRG